MALKFLGYDRKPNYIALSSDIVASTIDGISLVGGTVYTTDDSKWYIIEIDLTLSEVSDSSVTVSSGTITEVQGGAIKDDGAAWTSVLGVSGAAVVSADITTATAITDAPSTGQKLVITDIIVSTDTSMNILFEEETSGTDLLKIFIPAYGAMQITPRSKMKLATINKKLTAKGSVAGNVAITVLYYSEA